MPEISISINGRNYPISCEEGEEEHIIRLGRYIDNRVKDLARKFGQIEQAQLLVMTSLVIADELSEANDRVRVAGDEAVNAVSDGLVERLDRAAVAIKGVVSQLERDQAGLSSASQLK